MCLKKPKGGGDAAAAAAAKRQAAITQGTADVDAALAPFNDDYYSGIESAYTGYAQPTLDQNYQDALKQLAYSLERRGLSNSTAAASEQARLEDQFNQYRTDVINAGKTYAQKARTDTENTRSQLISQLSATEDPAAAAAGAVRYAARINEAPTFDPIGQFVFNVSEGLKGATAANGYQPMYSPNLFSGASSSSGGTKSGNGSISYNN